MAERANDIRPGQVLEHNGGLFLVVGIMHTQPGKGGAYIQAEMKNIKTGAKHYERFRSDATIRRAILDEEEYVYLFTEGNIVNLMHPSNLLVITINLDLLGEKKIYLQDKMKIKVVAYQDKIISAHVPDYVTLAVKETESVIKGQTATASYKPAILENGMRVNVPQFIKEEDKIVVYTPGDSYYERVKRRMSISSPRINVMLDSVRNASRQLMRDFNELQISNVKSADFINKTYSKSKQTIYDCLHDYKRDYDFIFEDDTDQEVKDDTYTWFIMPIEGRENFSSCMVYFAVSVCLIHKNKVVAAVIDAPALRETFWTEEKKGAFLEDFRSRHIKMRVKTREGGLIDVSGNLLNKLLPGNTNNVRSIGSTILGFAYLAAGRHRGTVYSGVNKYKALLGRLFLQESGGRLTEDNG